MVNIIFQDPGIARFLNKFPLHTLRPNLRHPEVEAGYLLPTRRGQTFGQRTLANKHSCLMSLTRFTALPCPAFSNARLASPPPDRYSPQPSSRPRPGRGTVLGHSRAPKEQPADRRCDRRDRCSHQLTRSEEHTSELQSLRH